VVCVCTGALANIFVYEGAPNVLRPCINRLLDWNYKVALIFNFFPFPRQTFFYFFPPSISQETTRTAVVGDVQSSHPCAGPVIYAYIILDGNEKKILIGNNIIITTRRRKIHCKHIPPPISRVRTHNNIIYSTDGIFFKVVYARNLARCRARFTNKATTNKKKNKKKPKRFLAISSLHDGRYNDGTYLFIYKRII